MLVARAGMIDFVKVGGVVPAGFSLQGVLFIQQIYRGCVIAAVDDDRRGIDFVAVSVLEQHFMQRQAVMLRRQAHIAAVHRDRLGSAGAVRQILPFEAIALRHARGIKLVPVFAVAADFHPERTVVMVDAAVIEHMEIPDFAQVERDLLIRRIGHIGGLRRFHGTQVHKGQHPIGHRHAGQDHPVPFGHFPGGFLLGKRRSHGRFGIECDGFAPAQHAAQGQRQKADQRVQRGGGVLQHRHIALQPHRGCVQMSGRAADADVAVQRAAHVQEPGHRHADGQPQDTDILVPQIAQQKQRYRRKQIPLVHHGAGIEQKQQQSRAEHGQMLCVVCKCVQRGEHRHGVHDHQGAQGGVIQLAGGRQHDHCQAQRRGKPAQGIQAKAVFFLPQPLMEYRRAANRRGQQRQHRQAPQQQRQQEFPA